MTGSAARRFVVLLLLVVLLLVGCEAIFTYSPLSGLQRNPADMTPAQRLTYAQDALASGDKGAMKTAYDAIKNDKSSEAVYTTAQLGIELSGVPDVLLTIASDTSTMTTQLNDIDTFIAQHGLDPTYMVNAATQLSTAAAGGETLTTMDYVMGSMGTLLGSTGGTWDLQANGHRTNAQAYLAPALADVASLPTDDPLRKMVEDYNNYLSGLPA